MAAAAAAADLRNAERAASGGAAGTSAAAAAAATAGASSATSASAWPLRHGSSSGSGGISSSDASGGAGSGDGGGPGVAPAAATPPYGHAPLPHNSHHTHRYGGGGHAAAPAAHALVHSAHQRSHSQNNSLQLHLPDLMDPRALLGSSLSASSGGNGGGGPSSSHAPPHHGLSWLSEPQAPNQFPPRHLFTCSVGRSRSKARYSLANSSEVADLLEAVVEQARRFCSILVFVHSHISCCKVVGYATAWPTAAQSLTCWRRSWNRCASALLNPGLNADCAAVSRCLPQGALLLAEVMRTRW